MNKISHQPVMLSEVIDLLAIKPGQAYLDCTLGSAGHAQKIIDQGGRLFAIDQDPQAIAIAKSRLQSSCPQAEFHLKRSNFNRLSAAAKDFGVNSFAGILLDLGLSSEQLADPDRGFSFAIEAPLDMRADPDLKVTAADLVNGLYKRELSDLLNKYGQEQYHLAIAKAIVEARQQKPITTTLELASIVSSVKKRTTKIHPATKTFQALRISVNDELNNLKKVLPQAVELLSPQGRLLVISFHSLEDKIVKNFFKQQSCLQILTSKPITPSQEEITNNPRARSAKLRLAQKI